MSEDRLVQSCIQKVNENLKEQMKQMVKEAVTIQLTTQKEEIDALKAEINELKTSQEFICSNYDNLKTEYDSLLRENKKQPEELRQLNTHSEVLEKQSESEAMKLDQIEQYGRRQNLEFHGIPETESEDVTNIVVDISKVLGVYIGKQDISIAHRLPAKRHRDKAAEPPAIIAKFISAETCNRIYKHRSAARNLNENDFPVAGMSKLYVNENLTQIRKRLLWKAKQMAKERDYAYIWTTNGRILVRKDADTNAIAILCDKDLSKL